MLHCYYCGTACALCEISGVRYFGPQYLDIWL